MKEFVDFLPKSIKFNSASDDLKEECINFLKSFELQGKSQLTIVEYSRTISHFITFLENYLGHQIKLVDIKNLDKVSISSYLAFYRNPEKNSFLKNIKNNFKSQKYFFVTKTPKKILDEDKVFFSKKDTDEQPLDIASRPIAPDPAKQSRNETLVKSILKPC